MWNYHKKINIIKQTTMPANRAQQIEIRKKHEVIKKYRKDNPHISYRQIGEEFSLSGQRIHQIIKGEQGA